MCSYRQGANSISLGAAGPDIAILHFPIVHQKRRQLSRIDKSCFLFQLGNLQWKNAGSDHEEKGTRQSFQSIRADLWGSKRI